MLEIVLAFLVAVSLLLHHPKVKAKILASKTKADDLLLKGVDTVKDLLKK
jgi:hypothetical protein